MQADFPQILHLVRQLESPEATLREQATEALKNIEQNHLL